MEPSICESKHGLFGVQPRKVASFLESTYFWGKGHQVKEPATLHAVPATGYAEARTLLPDHNIGSWEAVAEVGLSKLRSVFSDLKETATGPDSSIAQVSLSDELQAWRDAEHRRGRILPAKGFGIQRASDEVIDLFGVGEWPPPLLTNNVLFGSGMANFVVGAFDPEVLYSNYCVDIGFYYEHGYNKVFGEFEPILREAAEDPHAKETFGGTERREIAALGLRYIRKKDALEERAQRDLANKTAKLNRKEALALNLCDCSMWGMAAEMLALGADKGGLLNDFAFSAPNTDVIDVGSDLINSELFNSFLNTTNITDSGIVTEKSLRCIYDAYAHSVARTLTERWSDPGARLCSMLYSWHIQNDRHHFLRRIVLGYSKVRSDRSEQREADFDEVFDERFHTTGVSRPLKGSCNGEVFCNQVNEHLARSHGDPLLKDLWFHLSEGPLAYASTGTVDQVQEDELIEGLRLAIARAYSYGIVDELSWFMAHASQHAWQVNYLYEAAMFGSLLDDAGLKGRLDRFE